MPRAFALIAALAASAGCTAAAPSATVPPPPPCPVVASSDWRAWVNAMPGPASSRPTLIVVGNVTLPSGGWTVRFTDRRVLESYPVQVVVELDAASSGAGIQVPVTSEVRGDWPSEEAVGSVTIMCRGTTLARISPVVTAH